jgi:hypothetical protein
MGKIVLFLYPIPNSRMLPSDWKKHFGLVKYRVTNRTKNTTIAAVVGCF